MKKALFWSFTFLLILGGVFGVSGQKTRKASIPAETNTVQAVFGSVEAYSDGAATFLRWQMAVEQNNIGFFIYRRTRGGGYEKLSPERMVRGSRAHYGDQPAYGETYTFVDLSGNYRSTYIIESVLLDGTSVRSSYFLPQFAYDLRAVAGDALDTSLNTRPAPELTKVSLGLDRDLATEVASYAVAADPNVHRTVISQPGVKIGIRKDGFYRITRAQLQAGGFNIDSDPNFWQLYVDGIQQAMIVEPAGNYIEFLARGTDTPETDIKIYYLIVGTRFGNRISGRTVRPPQSTVISPGYSQTAVRKERATYIDELLNGDAENFWGRAIGATATTYSFSLTGIDFGSAQSTLRINFQGYSNTPHSIELFLNGQSLAPTTGNEVFPYSGTYTIPTSMLVEGTNNLQMRSAGPAGDFNLFDSLSVAYNRKYLADQDRVFFFTQNFKNAQLRGFTASDVRIFDITNESNPVQLTDFLVLQDGAAFGVDLPATTRGRVLFATAGPGLLQPESITANDPALLGVPTNQANLVIIAYKDYLTQAETWANYRRGQGFTVKVIEVSEIYDEFNYGSLSSASIRSFLQYATQNWQTPPQYVLLIGDACFDSRNYQGTGYWNQVPTRLVDTTFSTTASDEWLGDFNLDGLSEVAIGRIATRNTQGVTTVFNKVVTWEGSLNNPLDRGAVCAADFPEGYDFQAMCGRILNQLPQSMPKTVIFRGDPDSSNTLISAMNTGKYIINYSGHGTTGSWGGSPVFFNIFSVPQLTNASNPSIFTMLTCLNGYFHNLVNESFAEVLTKAQNGGAVAAWASSGLTTPDVQEIMGQRFYNQIGVGNITRLGDLVKDAKAAVPGGSSVRFSWALIGDPMMKVR